ncbi:MAG TPA: nitroreductase family protein [Candidatus Obscuribacterales bacterium]
MRALKQEYRTDVVPLTQVVQRRRATPSFKGEPVPDDVLRELLELATLAPSGYNLQPWRFIVVRDAEKRKKLRAAAMKQPKVEEAPVVIIACGHTAAWRSGDLEEMIALGQQFGTVENSEAADRIRRNAARYLESVDINVWVTRQTMIALTHLMLLAEAYGLDTAPMEGFWEDKVKEAFGIPHDVRVIALLAIGYAQEPDKPFGGRFDLSKVVFEETWGGSLS